MINNLPFIYIASLPRTGSTVLSEALTRLPYSFVFNEPHLGKNYFALQNYDLESLSQCNFDLRAFLKFRLPTAFLLRRVRWIGFPQDYMIRVFKDKILSELGSCVMQIGVKEINNKGWENYVRHFKQMKVILTGRDPRDIYISLYTRWKSGTLHWRRGKIQGNLPFNPQTVADKLNQQFRIQCSLADTSDFLHVRYEDLCQDPSVLSEIKKFVESPIPGSGAIGSFTSRHPRRNHEFRVHGHQITAKQIFRWKRETNQDLLADAHILFDLMPEYCDFWEYAG